VTYYWYVFHWNQTINSELDKDIRGFSWEGEHDGWNKVTWEVIYCTVKFEVSVNLEPLFYDAVTNRRSWMAITAVLYLAGPRFSPRFGGPLSWLRFSPLYLVLADKCLHYITATSILFPISSFAFNPFDVMLHIQLTWDKKVKLSLCFNWTSRHEGILEELRYSSMHSWLRH
jgi:hypothetical protein